MTTLAEVKAGALALAADLFEAKANKAGDTFTGVVIVENATPVSTDSHTLYVQRVPTYTNAGGTENAALHLYSQPSVVTGGFEDCLMAVLDNYASGGQHVTAHLQANKRSTGPTWNIANEVRDMTGNADPTTGLIGIEQVVAANGTDTNRNRVGFDILAARPQSGSTYTGAAATIGVALRIVKQIADSAGNRFSRGIQFGTPAAPTDFDVGVDLSNATFGAGGPAIMLANGHSVSFTSTNDRTWDYASGQMNYRVGGSPVFWLTDNGSIVSAGNKIRIAFGNTPSSATATGNAGEICWDSGFLYCCVAPNTWKRAALATW